MTKVTPNLCCHRRREHARLLSSAVYADFAAGPGTTARGDSDSEGEYERSCCLWRRLRVFRTSRRQGWRRHQLEPRGSNGPVRVRCRRGPASIFTDEWRRSRVNPDAALVCGHAWGRRCGLMLASAVRTLLRMTPHTAQQCGALSQRQCQHDRNEGCSEHVDARQSERQDTRHPFRGEHHENLGFKSARRLTATDLRNFASRCRKFPTPTWASRS